MSSFKSLLSILAVLLSFIFGASAYAGEGESAANVNIGFVTDLSGSMKSNNLVDPTRSFLHEFIGELLTGDRVIMTSFGTEIGVNNPMNISERNRQNDIDTLKVVVTSYEFSQNYTYTSGALLAACEALNRQRGPQVLVLLSDGKEEVPPGSDAKWGDLSASCSGIAIHVVALTAASKPTLDKIGQQLGATVHDATQKSLTEIGNEIRSGIRVFVESNTTNIELGNVKLGEAGEIRADFTVTGASSSIELTPNGSFPEGAQFSCPAFTAPGDMRCQLTVTEALQPGAYTGKVSFTPSQGNLAVVTPTLEIKFSRGMTQVTLSEDELSLGAMRPGETQVISIDFEASDSATPQPITLSLSGFPDGTVTLEPSQIMVPAENVEIKITFVGGDPGNFSGQLVLTSSSPTMQVQPAALPVSFHRRVWYWENWRMTVPGTILAILVIIGAVYFGIIKPRRDYNNRPLLQGRLESGGNTIQLDSSRNTQVIEDCTFRATGNKQHLIILVTCSGEDFMLVRQNGEEIPLLIGAKAKLKHGDRLVDAQGQTIWTYQNLNQR